MKRDPAEEIYFRWGKKAAVVVRILGYPSMKQPGQRVRIYEANKDLHKGLKPRKRNLYVKKTAADEHYLTQGIFLAFTCRSIGYSSNEVLKNY